MVKYGSLSQPTLWIVSGRNLDIEYRPVHIPSYSVLDWSLGINDAKYTVLDL